MKTKANILFVVGILAMISFNLCAQEDNDYSNNRGNKEKQNTDAINTKKETPVKIIQYIVGTWEVDHIYNGNKDITNTDTLGSNRIIEFNREGRYMITSGGENSEVGSYRLNENHSILYLERDNSQQPSEWKVSFSNDGLMTLQPTGTYPHAENFKYVYSRTSTATKNISGPQKN